MYVIDGYNLMHAAGLMKRQFGPGGLEKARRALVGVLAGSLGDDATNVTIIFDAQGEEPSSHAHEPLPVHGMHIEFASASGGADARIEQLIYQESSPKRLTVVSTDSRIRAAAKRRGAVAVTSEEFWHGLVERRSKRHARTAHTPDKPRGEAHHQKDWVREFEGLISDDDLRELAGPFGNET